MKICSYCGKALANRTVICPQCHCPFDPIGNEMKSTGSTRLIIRFLAVAAVTGVLIGLKFFRLL